LRERLEDASMSAADSNVAGPSAAGLLTLGTTCFAGRATDSECSTAAGHDVWSVAGSPGASASPTVDEVAPVAFPRTTVVG
jgi:hypothetical protein